MSWRAGKGGAIERAMFRMVAAKEASVDHDAANDAGETETNDAPIEARRTAPAAFPSIHPLAVVRVLVGDKDRRAGFQQVLLGRKKIIARHKHRAPQPLRRQID